MDSKSTEWRPGPTVCRCCLTEGCYKDISTEYFWMGKREVYAEMLSDTFNVTIAYSQSGGPNSNSRLICEPCISRLRDACDFRRQVLECEKTFMQHLDPGSSVSADLEVNLDPMESDVKLERIKLEKRLSDDDFDDRDFDDDDDDDDLDDEPLTKLASKIPKKETVDLMDLLDNTKAAEKRKSSTKTKASPAKKAKIVKKEPPKATVSKVPPKTEKKKKEKKIIAARRNARTIIQYTTAYPFKLPDTSMVCVFCCESYDDPSQFRNHMRLEHQDFKMHIAFAHIPEGFIKVDCTELSCRLCGINLVNIQQAANHLIETHNKPINLNHDLGMHPFVVEKDKYSCAICHEKHSTLSLLSKHMHRHFVQYTCDACGKSYATKTSLHCHLRYNCGTGPSLRKCRKCKGVFKSIKERQEHLEKSRRCCQHVCNLCGDRFVTWTVKQSHMTEVHNVPAKTYPCPECSLVFAQRDKLRAHFKIDHTNDYVECSYCEKRFENDRGLKKHIVIHTGERRFICTVCAKAFPRKSTLDQHMWIHSEVKRHECKMCDKQFNQKVSWRTHMKSRHPELCNF